MIETFNIDIEFDADYFLSELLAEPKYRSIDEVAGRVQNVVKGKQLQKYCIDKAKEILKKTYGQEIE